MSKLNFNVEDGNRLWSCYFENGLVWYIDRDGNPVTGMREPMNVHSVPDAKEIVIITLNGHAK